MRHYQGVPRHLYKQQANIDRSVMSCPQVWTRTSFVLAWNVLHTPCVWQSLQAFCLPPQHTHRNAQTRGGSLVPA